MYILSLHTWHCTLIITGWSCRCTIDVMTWSLYNNNVMALSIDTMSWHTTMSSMKSGSLSAESDSAAAAATQPGAPARGAWGSQGLGAPFQMPCKPAGGLVAVTCKLTMS